MLAQMPTWSTKAPMPTPRSDFGVAVVNGVLYAIGGVNGPDGVLSKVEAYDPVSDTWTVKTPMPSARYDLGIGVVNGIVYAVGGTGSVGDHLRILNTVEVYDPVTNTWATKPPMPTARSGLAVGVVDGILYAVGGSNPAAGLNTVEAYDPVAGIWYGRTPMRRGKSDLGVGVVGHRLYAVGGDDISTFGSRKVTEAYDPVSNSWTDRAEMPRERTSFGVAIVGGILYAVGGFEVAQVDAYDPASDHWTTPSRVPTQRASLNAGAIGGIIYAVGGDLLFGRGAVALNEALDLNVRPSVAAGGVVNGASFRAAADPNGAVAPGTIVSIFGSDLSQGRSQAETFPLPTTLAGASVFFNGIAAPLFYALPEQINAQVPFEVSTGTVSMEVHRDGTAAIPQLVNVADVSPGIFVLNGGAAAILHAGTFQLVTDSNPVSRGESISIYSTGLGQLQPAIDSGASAPSPPPETVARPEVVIAGIRANVSYSGAAAGYAGLYQVNAEVPVATPPGAQGLQLIINGVPSNTVKIAVQ